MSAGPRQRFRGDIEGLRAVAVLLVLVYHVGVSHVPGGFAGVDVFFVISGFLITSHLLKEVAATGTVRLARFYARRARRLLPAATIVLVFTAGAGFLVLPRVELTNLAADVAAAAVYIVNWTLAWRSVDYLAEDARVSPVQHYWSLSVEEQFYLGWPLLILLVLVLGRRLTARTPPHVLIGWAIAVVSLGSFAWSVHYTAVNPQMAFFATPTRIWELGAGALIALSLPRLRSLPRAAAEVLAVVGVVLLALSALVLDSTRAWPGSAALLPVLGTTAVIVAGCAHPDTATARALGVRPMAWIGGVSYSVYLWHWPLIILAKHLWPGISLWQTALVGAASIPLAWLTKVFIEDPIRFGRGRYRSPARALALGGAGMALSVAAAGAVYAAVPQQHAPLEPGSGALALVADREADGLPQLISDPREAFTVTGPITPAPLAATDDIPRYYGDGCHAPQAATEPFLDCVYGVPDAETRVAVLGDSKVGQWVPALEVIAERENWRLEIYVKSACGFMPAGQYEECHVWNANVLAHLVDNPPDLAILSNGRSTVSDVRAPAQPDEVIVEGMVAYWSQLQDAGTTLVAVTDNPTPDRSAMPGNPESVYECVSEQADDYLQCSFPYNIGNGTAALREASIRTQVELVDLSAWICPGQEVCPPVIGDVLVYRQGSHLTGTYIRSLSPILHRELIGAGIAETQPMPLALP